MTWLLVPLVGTLVIWMMTMRRTPWALPWLFGNLALGGFGALEVAGASGVHHTLAGMIAVSVASLFPQILCAIGTEFSRSEDAWGRAYRSEPCAHWTVVTKATKLDDGTHTVWLGVRSAESTRWIGKADPIGDMDAFMDMRAKADQAAETLNALKVGG